MEDNNELLKAYKSGDRKALERIIETNSGLVKKIANKYAHVCEGRVDYEDLLQEGYMGLMKAADYFEIEQGFQFSTYAVLWIKQKVRRYIDNNKRGIRIPVHTLTKINKIKISRERLLKYLNREPTVFELAKYINSEPNNVLYLLNLDTDMASLDTELAGGEDESTLLDIISDNDAIDPETTAINSELKKDLIKLINEALSYDEEKIIRLRYGFDGDIQTLEYIGSLLGKTGERIRQIEYKSLRKLRNTKYIRKIVAERQLEQKYSYYVSGFDPVARNAMYRIN